MNAQEKLLKQVVNQILREPEKWDQSCWHSKNSCGTTHCVAGWLQVMSGKPQSDVAARGDAKEALGLSDNDANWLFAADRSLRDIYSFAKRFNCDGYDRDGYDRDGYDRVGFNCDGFNRAGFNRAGFNRDGYDRAGFNRAGFNRDGYGRDGFNRDGYDRDGYDRDGYDRDGFNCDGFNCAGFNRAGEELTPFELE